MPSRINDHTADGQIAKAVAELHDAHKRHTETLHQKIDDLGAKIDALSDLIKAQASKPDTAAPSDPAPVVPAAPMALVAPNTAPASPPQA